MNTQIRQWFNPLLRRKPILSDRAIGWGSLSMSVIASSTYNAFAKDISSALSPLSLLCLSQVIIVLIILFSFGALPMLKKFLKVPRQAWLPLIAVGLTSGVLAPFLWFAGLASTTAVNSSLFGKLDMIFMLLLAFAFLKERWTREHVVGGIIVGVGIAVILLRGGSTQVSLHWGDALIILSCFVFAVGSLLFGKCLHGIGPETVILWRAFSGIAAFFLLAPFLPYSVEAQIRSFPLFLIPALLGFSFISQFVNIFTFYEAMDRLPITTISAVTSLEIPLAALFAHLYLHEALHWYHIVGGLLILIGTLALERLGTHPSDAHLEEHLAQERGNA